MDNLFSNELFEIPCPKCKKEIQKPLSWFNKDIVSCPFCKAAISTRKFRAKLQATEKESARVRKQL
ncbi:conserved hypothetical protein [Pedosphaera parvula Ellin514]|uniref:Uncharacterized protein n=1 Tax=Pedosphaera parvula (strain Ellin514) TaxID=320771 RepID=B9XT09_PEDPL|nr:conserved hypothetical protein [Pedosphaera parvula Ellin514]